MYRHIQLGLASVALTAAMAGCCNSCFRKSSQPPPPPPPGGGSTLPPGMAPVPFPTGAGAPPPSGFSNVPPPPPQPIAGPPPSAGAVPPPPAPVSPQARAYPPTSEPPLNPNWAERVVQLAPPEPIAEHVTGRTQLSVPDGGLLAPSKARPASPATGTGLPVGIPQFAPVMPGVTTGLRPMLDDGLDWLQSHGYRAVLHVRSTGEADSADRKQAEKRSLQYLSLELSPQTLTRAQVDEFLRIVRDSREQPLFVYDRDGALTGALWYAYFRKYEGAQEETARVRAARLGLRENSGGLHREMFVAVQALANQ